MKTTGTISMLWRLCRERKLTWASVEFLAEISGLSEKTVRCALACSGWRAMRLGTPHLPAPENISYEEQLRWRDGFYIPAALRFVSEQPSPPDDEIVSAALAFYKSQSLRWCSTAAIATHLGHEKRSRVRAALAAAGWNQRKARAQFLHTNEPVDGYPRTSSWINGFDHPGWASVPIPPDEEIVRRCAAVFREADLRWASTKYIEQTLVRDPRRAPARPLSELNNDPGGDDIPQLRGEEIRVRRIDVRRALRAAGWTETAAQAPTLPMWWPMQSLTPRACAARRGFSPPGWTIRETDLRLARAAWRAYGKESQQGLDALCSDALSFGMEQIPLERLVTAMFLAHRDQLRRELNDSAVWVQSMLRRSIAMSLRRLGVPGEDCYSRASLETALGNESTIAPVHEDVKDSEA